MRIPYYLLSNPPQEAFYSLSFICLEYSHSVLLYSITFLSPLLQKVFYNLHIPFLVLITFSTFTLIRAGHFNLSIYDWIARTTFLWKLICRWAIFISFQWQFSLVLKSHSGPLKAFCILTEFALLKNRLLLHYLV